MYFDSLSAALQMDGHGAFVWAAYVITLTVIAIMFLVPSRRARLLLVQLRADRRRAAGRSAQETTTTAEGIDASGT